MPITLRLLLSHRSSLTDGIDYVLPIDAALQDALADPKAWDTGHAPGTYWRYTNLNFPVIASVMERATGERFDRLMARLVLTPLKLDACFNWAGCSPATRARAVVLYRDRQPVKDDPASIADCPVTPRARRIVRSSPMESGRERRDVLTARGACSISMRDLATIGRMLLGNGDGGRGAAAQPRVGDDAGNADLDL